jgi:hypothetical protein
LWFFLNKRIEFRMLRKKTRNIVLCEMTILRQEEGVGKKQSKRYKKKALAFR